MKNYSSNRAQKGKTAYRTPSLFRANKAMATAKDKSVAVKSKIYFDRNQDNPYLKKD